MHISLDSSGTREQVKQDIATQVASARSGNESAAFAIQAVADTLYKRMVKVPGEKFTVHADLVIDITVTKEEASDAEPFVVIGDERLTRADFEQRLAAAQHVVESTNNADASLLPLVDSLAATTPHAKPTDVISSDE